MIEVKTERQNGVLSASVDGRIDGSNVVEFEETIRGAIDKDDRAVIMDFEKLSYISSAGLRAILLTGKTLGSQNAKLVLCSLPDPIREVFEISGFDRIFTIHPSRTEALAALGAA